MGVSLEAYGLWDAFVVVEIQRHENCQVFKANFGIVSEDFTV